MTNEISNPFKLIHHHHCNSLVHFRKFYQWDIKSHQKKNISKLIEHQLDLLFLLIQHSVEAIEKR